MSPFYPHPYQDKKCVTSHSKFRPCVYCISCTNVDAQKQPGYTAKYFPPRCKWNRMLSGTKSMKYQNRNK